jgi:hypothetical protein
MNDAKLNTVQTAADLQAGISPAAYYAAVHMLGEDE